MDVLWQKILVGAALVFTGFLVWKYRPRLPFLRTPARRRVSHWGAEQTKVEVERGREKARAAKTPRGRAAALVFAAEAAAQAADGLTSAMGLYLRAMRAD